MCPSRSGRIRTYALPLVILGLTGYAACAPRGTVQGLAGPRDAHVLFDGADPGDVEIGDRVGFFAPPPTSCSRHRHRPVPRTTRCPRRRVGGGQVVEVEADGTAFIRVDPRTVVEVGIQVRKE